MSVGQDFDRSILERKDRAALLAIAQSLGAKPSSRAKKADIVDVILAAAGHIGDDSSTEPDAAAGPATAATDTRAEAEQPALVAAGADEPSSTRTERNGGNGSGGGAKDEKPKPAGGDDARERSGSDVRRAGRDRADRSAGANQPGSGDRNQADLAVTDPNKADESSADENKGDQNKSDHNKGGQAQGGQGSDQGGQGDTEPGNRRRRRRGRDRRNDDEAFQGEPVGVEGLLDLREEGYGFLRLHGYLPSKDDVYVSVKQVRQFGLRKGDTLTGKSRPASRQEKNPALLQIDAVNGDTPEKAQGRPRFDDLTPLFPDERLSLELKDDPSNMTARIIDLVSPIGKGQRGMIVSPPKAGKTTVMKQIARSIEINDPDVALFVLLVDERPEEVTDMKRWLINGEVAASTFDRPSEEHTQVAELVLEKAKRMVEAGRDVVIILDGITRLARAYNLAAPATGRIMSGGIDTGALYPPKKFFGAARNVEEGGSLTILATALVETGSRMDEVIFEEFKGTGNMELKLDRRMADRRIYPAIDVEASSTRHEELLFEHRHLQQVWRLRRVLGGLKEEGASDAAGLEMLIDRMKTFKTNDEFLKEIAKAQVPG